MSNQPVMITVVLGLAVDAHGRYLLTQRYAPEHPEVHLKWQLPGGGMEFGENPEQTVTRELFEEVGAAIEIIFPQPLVKTSVWHAKPGGHQQDTHVTLLVYLVKVITEPHLLTTDEETHDLRWYTLAEAMELDSLPMTREFLVEADELQQRLALT